MNIWGLSLGLLATASLIFGELLTPPYFNLANGRKIHATATCGEGDDVTEAELYCKLVGANADADNSASLIQGQVCDICDPRRPDKRHPAEYAVDGSETWWQSPPISRSVRLNEVNLTIDFGQAFHVAYVFVRMANSPRPGVWALEKSMDYGKTFTPWQYFADSPADCEHFFGKESLQPITKDNSVVCDTQFSKVVPLEGGEIVVSLLNNRPSWNNFFNSSVLQEWTRATNVRLRLLRTKTLLGHLMSVARQDPTVTRRYFYSIKDISIGGRCMCNGHADTCDNTDLKDPYKLVCRCQHNTCGDGCEMCCPEYRQEAWRVNKANDLFVCQPCNCYGHADTCEYSAEVERQHLSIDVNGQHIGGGVCQDCRHNTEGINCNQCKSKFYRPYNKPLNATDVCQPCNCDVYYSTGNCSEGTGACECRPEFQGPNCDSCSFGYYGYPDCRPCDCYLNGTSRYTCDAAGKSCPCLYNYGGPYCKECAPNFYDFPNCLPCECNEIGSSSIECEKASGNCTCKSNYRGRSCDQCAHGYYSYPECSYCSCDSDGTVEEVCNKNTGDCLCKEGFAGDRCDQCAPGYYGYPNCKSCDCSSVGSVSPVCDATGKCPCLGSFSGRTCESCSPGHFKYPECLACNCDASGAFGISCNDDGVCQCKNNFQGLKCDTCTSGFYNFPICEECNCNPAGTSDGFLGCGSVPPGELCQCKPHVQGRICSQCRPLYWNLLASNPEGCIDCDCHHPGVLGGIMECDQGSGQCICKPGIDSRRCDECQDEFYQIKENDLFGCSSCDCDIGGAENNYCEKSSGQCFCHPRVTGRDCSKPLEAHYFPTLFSQLQFEAEDSYTPGETKAPVRYDFLENLFPGYSWKGFAVFSHLQSKILQDIYVTKPSEYRLVLRYVNPNNVTSTGTIKIMPENVQEPVRPILKHTNAQSETIKITTEPNEELVQSFPVVLRPSWEPTFVTIPGPLVLNSAGAWTINIALSGNIYLDYFVLLPAAFYEATILEKRVENPCKGDNSGPQLCRSFAYPFLRFPSTGPNSFYISDEKLPPSVFFNSNVHLDNGPFPILTAKQVELSTDLEIQKPGRYILVASYVTPVSEQRSFPVDVDVKPGVFPKGRLQLTPCPYDMSCRQAVIDTDGRINIYALNDSFAQITLKTSPEWDSDIALVSITAVPVERWSNDYIIPSSLCIKKDGQCLPNTYPVASDSIKIEMETALPDAAIANLHDSTKMIHVKDQDGNITIHGKVPYAGNFIIVVQYHQPLNPSFKLPVVIENRGVRQNAELAIQLCPGTACRTQLNSEKGIDFNLDGNFSLTFTVPPMNEVYLDHVLLIDEKQYTPIILEESLLDQSEIFISECGQNHFYIDVNTTGFCRDAVFSLTMQHFDGALKCECSYDGSLSFECNSFGGQCQCKPNVIGRRCTECKTGYYGFPNCRPCSCPNGICDSLTGECECPDYVKGELCDQCDDQTYGYDRIYGCSKCNCDPRGVEGNNMNCHSDYGTCSCKPNVIDRTCDKCKPGHWYFPKCEECVCDLRGTTPNICDPETSICSCKANVHGQACDLCTEGSFHVSESNPKGCTECFCFGKSRRCSSSNLYISQIRDLDGWKLAVLDTKKGKVAVELRDEPPELIQDGSEMALGADFTVNTIRDAVVYFVASDVYLQNKITSYGSYLSYTIFYTSGLFGGAVAGPDLIIHGADTYLMFTSEEQPPASVQFQFSIPILESTFRHPSGIPATREQIMQVLQSLTAIYIRATYWEGTLTARLSNVSLDVATTNIHHDAARALTVEQCQCPPNYQGLSCEECAPGFYRVQTGPFGGVCVPCKCNGHSEECDSKTGKCSDCRHNTHGDHCEFCDEGYQGDPTTGTPNDCLICACPIPTPSNNFATSCVLSPDGEDISCECKPEYYGARCESCAAGFYGRPEVLNETCKPCNCSGNINPEDPASCDSVTGKCLKCLNNTFGDACNLCAPFYHGDAVLLKDCQQCDCQKCGTLSCESYTGQCICQDNVIGEHCDRCAPDHYGYNQCQGCLPCECGLASLDSNCDQDTGKCVCQPGVVDRTCSRCAPGFWNYTEAGCQSCGCNTEFSVGVGCNPNTGQCECLPGVIGERCDQCPHRWVLKPDEGCFECNSCTHDLLDTTDELDESLKNMRQDLGSFAGGYFTVQRLRHINDSANALLDKVSQLDPLKFDLKGIIQPISDIESDSRTLTRQVTFADERGKELAEKSDEIRIQSLELEKAVHKAAMDTRQTVAGVNGLAESLEGNTSPQVDRSIAEAEEILIDMKKISFDKLIDRAENELSSSENIRSQMQDTVIPIYENVANIDNFQTEIDKFDNTLDDARGRSEEAKQIAERAAALNAALRRGKLWTKVYAVNNLTAEAENNLENAKDLLRNATAAVEDTRVATSEIVRERNRRIDARDNFNSSVNEQAQELEDLEEPVRTARIHADDLSKRAIILNDSFAESRTFSGHGVQAATAYSTISDDLAASRAAANEAVSSADDALLEIEGADLKAKESLDASLKLLEEARNSTSVVFKDIRNLLDKAKDHVENINNRTMDAAKITDEIEKDLNGTINDRNLNEANSRAIEESDAANVTTLESIAGIAAIIKKVAAEKDVALKLPKDVQAIKYDLNQARNEIDNVNKILPNISQLMDSLQKSQKKIKEDEDFVEGQIERLKRQVAEARDLANRIRVGVSFESNTYIQIKNPPDLAMQSTSTKVSGYFRSRRENGAILYLGNEIGTSRKLKRTLTDDFLSIELENGYPSVIIDLGSGSHRINSDHKIKLNDWYQFVVERNGKHVKFTIREDIGNGKDMLHEKEAVIPGSTSILNLDPEESKIYVGGNPPSAEIQTAVKHNYFEGEMEDFMIGDTPISLWNFKKAENNNGAIERTRLVNLTPKTGYRFNGNGYVAVNSSSYRMDIRSSVILRFKTTSPSGLLFAAGRDGSFISLELENGHVVYRYNLGDDTVTLRSNAPLNDDKWHAVEGARSNKQGLLKIDDNQEAVESSQGSSNILKVSDVMFFGGYSSSLDPLISGITNEPFDGCIDGVVVDTTSVDLSKHISAFGVSPGCPPKFANSVSFVKSQPGYIVWPNASATTDIDLSLRFKTSHPSGLILLVGTRDNTDPFSVALHDGNLAVQSFGKTLVTSSPRYDDDNWHVITVTHDNKNLKISVDDFESLAESNGPEPSPFRFANLYVGGVPASYLTNLRKMTTDIGFAGCISDVAFNGVLVNFANATNSQSAIVGKCVGADTPSPEFSKDPDESSREPKVAQPRTTTTTTTTSRPTTTTSTEPPPQICALPAHPAKDTQATFETNGYRFGTVPGSRLEFVKLPSRINTKRPTRFSFQFKTSYPDGVIFYAARKNSDRIGIFIKEGRIGFLFNTGSGEEVLTGPERYDDGQWHTVEVITFGSNGVLNVDTVKVAEGNTPGTTNELNLAAPFYVGGIDPQFAENATIHLRVREIFEGCIKDPRMNDKPMLNPTAFGVVPCSDHVESGAFFHPEGGYVKLHDQFKVGAKIEIKMDIKPRSINGVLLSVHGRKDYIILQMRDGAIEFTVDSGNGPVSSVFVPPKKSSFCDGNWHYIHAAKVKNIVLLTVNTLNSDPGRGKPGTLSIDTKHPLLLGGISKNLRHRFEHPPEQYVGCIRNVKIMNKDYKIDLSRAVGNVTVSACPTI